MHDPDVVAFDIRRPWPRRSSLPEREGKPRWKLRGCFWTIAGRELYWPSLITIWHSEPGGADMGEVCKHWRIDRHGKRVRSDRWKWHVHHWHVQVIPLQQFRRWALTRCEWCGGRSRKGDQINVSQSWDNPRSPWWRGERGLFHGDCSSVQNAYRTCTCAEPVVEHNGWGLCARCGRHRGFNASMKWLLNAERLREAIPEGERDRAAYERIVAATAAEVGAQS